MTLIVSDICQNTLQNKIISLYRFGTVFISCPELLAIYLGHLWV